jgi:hypothetical protein
VIVGICPDKRGNDKWIKESKRTTRAGRGGQCSTVLAMRMANDRDQAIVRAAVSDAGGGLLGFVPSLGTHEVL